DGEGEGLERHVDQPHGSGVVPEHADALRFREGEIEGPVVVEEVGRFQGRLARRGLADGNETGRDPGPVGEPDHELVAARLAPAGRDDLMAVGSDAGDMRHVPVRDDAHEAAGMRYGYLQAGRLLTGQRLEYLAEAEPVR